MTPRLALTLLLAVLSGWLSLSARAAPNASAATGSEFNLLAGEVRSARAMALVPGVPASTTWAENQPNDLVAALTALKSCEAVRTPVQPACELRRLNAETITSGAEIRAAVADVEHPLHLWQFRGPKSTVYLAGSVHILKPSLYPLPDAYTDAFEASEFMVVEVNVAAVEPAELQRKTLALAMLPDGQRLEAVLPPPLLDRVEKSLARYGLTLPQVATAKPAFLMNQLVLLRLTSLGYQGEYGVEQHFIRQIADKTVLELETIDEQLALLFDQPMPLQVQLLEDTLDQEPGIEPLIAGMVGAWFSGDDERFMEMFEAQSGDSQLARQFTEQLLDERNIGMAESIRTYLNGEGTYFVLVGAAHLLGENGIVSLLAQDGIPARRLTSGSIIH